MSEARVAAKLRARQEGRSVGQRVNTEDGVARPDDLSTKESAQGGD